MIEEIDCEPFGDEEVDETEDRLLDELAEEDASKKEITKVKKLLTSEVWKGECQKCGKLAVRIFPPRKKLDDIMKKEGIAGVMKSCQSDVVNQRVLIDTPSFNLVLTGDHSEVDGYNLSYTPWSKCDMGVLITDNPRELTWHLFSRLRTVRMACLINGISYDEVKDWFDKVELSEASLLMPSVIDFNRISDANKKLKDGPWYVGWINTDLIKTVVPILWSADVNGDPKWDSCMDPSIADDLALGFVEYSTTSCGDNLIHVSKFSLQPAYHGSTLYGGVVEPLNTPGKFVAFRTGLTKEQWASNPVISHLMHTVPTKYWCVEESRFRQGMSALNDKTGTILDLETR